MPLPDSFRPIPDISDPHCFGCGPHNPAGLHMRFFSDETAVASEVTLPSHTGGWHRITHGGILATILDEVMSWAAIYLLKRIILTKSMSVTYLRPVPVGSTVTAMGSVIERTNDREVRMAGEIRNEAGEVCVRSEGIFALFTLPVIRRLKIMDEAYLERFAARIATL